MPHRETSPQAFWLDQLNGADSYTKWMFDLISDQVKGHVLEVGCGIGTYTRMLSPLSTAVVAIDIDRAFVDEARYSTAEMGNVEVRLEDFNAVDHLTKFDTVVLLDVIEHLPDDSAALKKVYTLLAPGGRIVIKVPAMPWIFGRMDEAVGHFRRYSKRMIVDRLVESGFNPKQIRFVNLPGIAGWWVNGRLRSRKSPEASQVDFFNYLVPLIRRFESAIAPPIGLSLIAVAEKPEVD